MIEVFRKALMEAHHDDWDMETVSDAAHICADALRGFLVAKIPDCNRMDHPHGRHSLITRTASCPGKEPLPHGFANGHLGSFGWIVTCACGESFRDYTSRRKGLLNYDELPRYYSFP